MCGGGVWVCARACVPACVRTCVCVCVFKPPLTHATRYHLKKGKAGKADQHRLVVGQDTSAEKVKAKSTQQVVFKFIFTHRYNHVRFGPTYIRYASAEGRRGGGGGRGVGVGG